MAGGPLWAAPSRTDLAEQAPAPSGCTSGEEAQDGPFSVWGAAAG